MKLIDKRALMYQLHKQSQIDSKPRAIRRARRIVEECPTVDAIPVQFIQDRIDELAELAEYESEANGGYTGQAHTQMYELRRLINQWKAEQSDTSG